MSSVEEHMPLFMPGETYPIMLLRDALSLQEYAVKLHNEFPPDERQIPRAERAPARAAIFMAFNMVESLLIDLTQECISSDTSNQICICCKDKIKNELKGGKGSIVNTIKDWPRMLGKTAITEIAYFDSDRFDAIRNFRNQLIHPKLELPVDSTAPSQDDLLRQCTEANAQAIIHDLVKTAKALYTIFGKPIPVEFTTVVPS